MKRNKFFVDILKDTRYLQIKLFNTSKVYIYSMLHAVMALLLNNSLYSFVTAGFYTNKII